MSIFASILDKIFHHSSAQSSSGTSSSQPVSQPTAGQGGAASSPQQSQLGTSRQATSSAAVGGQQKIQNVDVEAVLSQLANTKGGGGNWRTSVVDLLKLLDLDSSLAARKSLAQELNVHVGADGSAEQNIALQKAVMNKIAENGGKVPDSLRH
jgi:hypothetical protein